MVLSKRVVAVHGKLDGLGWFADPSLLIPTSLADGPKQAAAYDD